MSCALFLRWTRPAAPDRAGSRADGAAILALLAPRADCAGAAFYEPAQVADPLLRATAGHDWMLRLDFAHVDALRRAAGPDGWIAALCRAPVLGPLLACELSAQAMRRVYLRALPSATPIPPRAYAYLAGYEGDPSDPRGWIAEYLDGHVPLMQELPGLRETAVYTRFEHNVALPGRPLNWMLRSHALFDTAQALAQALDTPVRRALREHRARMPPAGGQDEHLPMLAQRR